jgi:hypothetical protein
MKHDTEISNLLHGNLALLVPVPSDGGTEDVETGTIPPFPQKRKEQFHLVQVHISCNETTWPI